MKQYETYIFDLDGTITDTLIVWIGIFRDALLQFGITPPDDNTLSKHTHDWKEMLGLGLPRASLENFIQLAHELAIKRLPEAPLHLGAYETLQILKNHNKRIGIYSTLDRPIFELAMEHRKLNAIADVAVAGTDVVNRKPQPDGILKALGELGIAQEGYGEAVYIGDKDTDIQAANNAGINGVLYYPVSHRSLYDLQELKRNNPAYVMTNWNELVTAFK
jgi:phosphoglycolate phosphatase